MILSQAPSTPSWFQDEPVLLGELRRARTATARTVSISGYDEIREYKRGGQGVVYRAVQRSTER